MYDKLFKSSRPMISKLQMCCIQVISCWFSGFLRELWTWWRWTYYLEYKWRTIVLKR